MALSPFQPETGEPEPAQGHLAGSVGAWLRPEGLGACPASLQSRDSPRPIIPLCARRGLGLLPRALRLRHGVGRSTDSKDRAP